MTDGIEKNCLGKGRKNGKRGFKGVTWREDLNKWRARLGQKHLGYFDSEEEAIAVVERNK